MLKRETVMMELREVAHDFVHYMAFMPQYITLFIY